MRICIMNDLADLLWIEASGKSYSSILSSSSLVYPSSEDTVTKSIFLFSTLLISTSL